MGLTAEEAHQLQEHARKGDREGSLKLIADAQERKRAEFQADTGIDSRNVVLLIGRDISWGDIANHAFRVLEFERAGTSSSEGSQDEANGQHGPYGHLIVESPILSHKGRLPIGHHDDLSLAASVFDEPRLAGMIAAGEADLLVTYAPMRLLPSGLTPGPFHVLHYAIAAPGSLDAYYSVDNDAHMARPNPEELFGPFVYQGKLRVRVSPELGARVARAYAPAPTESRVDHRNFVVFDRDWSVVEGVPCRVIEFIPLGSTVVDEQVHRDKSTHPYASITLECSKIAGTVTGFVWHKVDFANLWAAFKDRGVAGDEEVIIIWSTRHYKPEYRIAKLVLPRMWVMICPKGATEIMSDENARPDLEGLDRWNATKPIVDWKPDVME
ncbi:MAG: hypothetical protein NTX53_03470 [candidate division WOR-3 bacterium]|nr:hypothetical protein [candidate division WOR-3 bacterium]